MCILQIEPGDTLPSLAVRYGETVDAIKRVNAIVSDADMYARDQIRIPDSATRIEKKERKSEVRLDKKMPEKAEKPKRAEKASDYFSKFDASVRVNAEKARSTLDRLKLDDSEGCDDEDTEVLNGEGMFELRKWSS